MAVAATPSLAGEKKRWWLLSRKIAGKYIREARGLMVTEDTGDLISALSLLDSALAASPRHELAIELRARCLVKLRRFRDVADMLQDYIPSLRPGNGCGNRSDESGSVSSDNSSQQLIWYRVKLLPSSSSSVEVEEDERDPSCKCFSVLELKRKVMAGLSRSWDQEGQWRYTVLGQACFHLGLMEDATVLLQTGKRLASAASRRESICWPDDSFSLSALPFPGDSLSSSAGPDSLTRQPTAEAESISQLLPHIKLLIRRRTAALAALHAGLHSEAIRHFSKIVDSRQGAPQAFLAECYLGRAAAYRAAGRVAESISDCNKTLALDPTCIQALETRAELLLLIRCLPDSLHDLEYLKLLYNSILRDRKLPGPPWKRHHIQYREIPGKLCALTVKTQELKRRLASGEAGNDVDYYALMGLWHGCSRSELERAHRLLTLRHKPDKAVGFLDNCKFAEGQDLDSARDRAKMSALLLYRLIRKGYTSIMAIISDDKAPAAAATAVHVRRAQEPETTRNPVHGLEALGSSPVHRRVHSVEIKNSSPAVFQGVFCRDLGAVSNLLSKVGFNRPVTVKYEALC